MNKKREKDEYLERLWTMKEEGTASLYALKENINAKFNPDVLDELSSEGLVDLDQENNSIILTAKGEDSARKIIRAHRLAERLLHDVLGGEFESGACEFEHTVTPELVDSICTLLGHPKECPHGMPIPEGECCKRCAKTAQSSIVPLRDLKVGQRARVAYINCKDDQRLHKIDGLRIRPGAFVKLHQRYPSYVIECEEANIALDEEIVANICVWKESSEFQPREKEMFKPVMDGERGRGRGGRGRGFMFRHRKRGD